jgi:hypothetical protein
MRSPRYPLEPLAQLRSRKVDEAARAYAASVGEREAAEGVKRAAEARRRRHEKDAADVRNAERAALDRGDLRAGDLDRAESWGAQAAVQQRSLEAAVERADAREKQARDAELAAQARTALRQADATVVAKDRARWDQAQRAAIDAREEEALDEACRPKR